ncbi:hypothetical protein GCM10009817_37690 [Terrabacter lapilli]|uniref:Glycosyltransferase 2-like domain-containing protein n=1 Tax=Terrabacter lapilli TaxID=436231 RepID=A0ABN2SV11_9MICO
MADCFGVIVLAAYRPAPTLLKRQLLSIMNQSFKHWSCIIGFDGPDPAAVALVRTIVGPDSRFRLVEFPHNVGVYRHFERLLTMVESEAAWIALSDQDDYWHQHKLETLVGALETSSHTGVACQARVVTDSGVELGLTTRRAKALVPLLLLNEVTGCFSIFRREVLTLALPFPAETELSIHDHWLGVCSEALQGFHFVDAVMHDYVQHRANAIGEVKLRSVPKAMASVMLGRESLGQITSAPWEWRITMAEALNARTSSSHAKALRIVAQGTLSPALVRLLFRQSLRGWIPPRVTVALAYAALLRRIATSRYRGRN